MVVIFVMLGVIAGAIHFALLRRNLGILVAGGPPARAVGAVLLRFALTVGIFLWAAVAHGLAVLWVLGGFVLARLAAVRIVQAGA